MIILYVLVIYISGIFATRQLDKIAYIKNLCKRYFVGIWFLSWIGFIATLIFLQLNYKFIKFNKNRFTGKYW